MPGSVTKADVDLKEKAREAAKKKWDSAEADKESAAKDCESKKAVLKEKDKDLAAAETELEAASKNLIEGIEDSDALARQINQYNSEIAEYDEQTKSMEEALTAAKKAHTELEQKIRQDKKERDAAKELLDAITKKLEDALSENGYADITSAKESLRTEEERTQMHKEIVEYETQCSENKSALEEKRKELEGQTEPDASIFNDRQKEITDELNEYKENHSVICSKIKELTEKKERLEKKNEHYLSEISEAEADLAFARTLRGDNSVGIQRYVLAVMFEQVIGYANAGQCPRRTLPSMQDRRAGLEKQAWTGTEGPR